MSFEVFISVPAGYLEDTTSEGSVGTQCTKKAHLCMLEILRTGRK